MSVILFEPLPGALIVFRFFPLGYNEAIYVNGVYLPYIDIIADDEEAAHRGLALLFPRLSEQYTPANAKAINAL